MSFRNPVLITGACVAAATCLGALVVPAAAEPCVLLDVGTDDDPWTIRTETTELDAMVRIVFEVPDVFVPGSWVRTFMYEGCCEDAQEIGHYGVTVEVNNAVFDDAYVDEMFWGGSTCLCCNTLMLDWHFAPDAPLVPGERYIIGEFPAHAICDMDPLTPCEPPHDIRLEPWEGPCTEPAPPITFMCPATPDRRATWGDVKARFR